MEMEEFQSEMQSLLRLYALHRWLGEGTRKQPADSSAPCPCLDERSWMLLKDLLDRKWETTLQTYSQSQLVTTTAAAPPNQPPPPPVLKRQCSHCQERTLKRQQSVHLQPKQIVRDTRSVAASSGRYEGSCSWTTRAETSPSRGSYTASSYTATDSASRSISSSTSSYSVETPAVKPVRRPMGRAGRARGRARGRTRSISSYSSSTYSVEKRPPALARAGPSCWGGARARGHHKIETLGRIITNKVKNKIGQVFQQHHHHPHVGSLWRQAKEKLLPVHRQSGNKPRSSKRPDEVDKKGKTVPAKKNLGRKKPKDRRRNRNRNP